MLQINNFNLGIGFPLSFPMVHSAFFESFIKMEKPDYHLIRSSSGGIDAMRNQIVERAKILKCTHLLMMDTDMIYDSKTIPTLLSRNLDIVGALCFRRYPPFDPLVARGKVQKFMTVDYKAGELVEVDYTGTGCLMIKMEVFDKLKSPWFYFSKNKKGEPIGEDCNFCMDARKAKYKIFVDTSIPSSHLTTFEVNIDTYNLYKGLAESRQRRIEEIKLKQKQMKLNKQDKKRRK